MDAQLAGQTARALDKPVAALVFSLLLLEGMDQVMAAIACREQTPYSPLRTIIAQGLEQATQVRSLLLEHGSSAPEPPPPVP
jgi:hypothetical protein